MHRTDRIDQIVLPQSLRDEILAHCRRKRAGRHLKGETREEKAFGMVAGIIDYPPDASRVVRATRIFPARVNARGTEPFKADMDRAMERYAIPSQVPISERGW